MTATLTKEQLRDRFEAAIRIKRGTASYLTAVRNDGEYVETWTACAFDGFCMAHASGTLVSVPAAELEALRRDAERLNK